MTAVQSASDGIGITEYLYRPLAPFTYEELQSMVQRGVMRHVIADVYAEALIPPSPALRAAGAHALLNRSCRRLGTLCGETAAWVHLGGPPPARLTIITDRTESALPAAGDVQIHRSRLTHGDLQRQGPLRCTTALRSAGDLFCGTGVRHLRRALDRVIEGRARADRILQQWPANQAPLRGRDEDVCAIGPEDERIVHERWHTIAQLLQRAEAGPEELADVVMRIVSRSGWDHRRRESVRQLADQCVSRRLPTVR